MSSLPSAFDDALILKYLGLNEDYKPSPATEPIPFLNQHLRQIPLQLLSAFSSITTPKQRTIIPAIRNRRLMYTASQPINLSFEVARSTWPTLWQGREPPGQERTDEREWIDREFLGGRPGTQHVGNLGSLLGDYAEEREAERVRELRRQAAEQLFVPEEEDSNESDDEPGADVPGESPDETRASFERIIRERFIYGLLDSIDYDSVDWNDRWDTENERDDEERWFNDEEED